MDSLLTWIMDFIADMTVYQFIFCCLVLVCGTLIICAFLKIFHRKG